MDGITRRWTAATAKQNLWRTRESHDLEDLMQEAALLHHKVAKKYPKATPAHRFALYQRAFTNRIHDISRRIRTQRNVTAAMVERGQVEHQHPDTSYDLVAMPAPLRKVLHALATDPRALVTFLWVGGGWETANQKLCRIAGIHEGDTPMVEQVKAYLSAAGFDGAYG